jgi:uncharacterized membrane protein YhaH (DUF805 family)
VDSPYSPYGQPGPYPPQDAPQGYQPQDFQAGGYPPGYPSERDYLQGGPVDFPSAVRLQLQNLTNFNGRASMSACWWYALAVFAAGAVLELLAVAIGSAPLVYLVALAAGLSGLSAGVRRMHDSGKSGWMLLLGLIPFVGWVIAVILLVLPGTPGQNRFG